MRKIEKDDILLLKWIGVGIIGFFSILFLVSIWTSPVLIEQTDNCKMKYNSWQWYQKMKDESYWNNKYRNQ